MSIELGSNAPDGVVRRLVERLKGESFSMVRLTDGTGILLDVRGMSILTLNETAVVIVAGMMKGEATLTRLVEVVMAGFDVSESTASCDVEAFLASLDSATLSSSDPAGNVAAR